MSANETAALLFKEIHSNTAEGVTISSSTLHLVAVASSTVFLLLHLAADRG